MNDLACIGVREKHQAVLKVRCVLYELLAWQLDAVSFLHCAFISSVSAFRFLTDILGVPALAVCSLYRVRSELDAAPISASLVGMV